MSGGTTSETLLQTKPIQNLQVPQSRKPKEEMRQRMEVQGSHRALLCRQPLRKQVASYPTVVVDLESGRKKVSFEREAEAEGKRTKEKSSVVITLPMKSEKLSTRGTQTDFRESETQTFPWKHEIQTEGKVLAELLSLDWFSLEKNFPPGMDEVRQIEKARQKLAWEDIIERLRGKKNEGKRKSLVLRITANDTAFREQKKEEENRERLEISKEQMRETRKAFEEKLRQRLQRSYCCQKRENSARIKYWNHQLTRNIRKAKSARERSPGKPDIIAMHKDRTSALYAPKLRNGENPSLWHEEIYIRCRYLKRFHGLEILEKHMADTFYPKLSEFTCQRLNSRSNKMDLSWRKFVQKVAEEPKERKLANLSLKIVAPAPTPEPQTTRPRSSSEEKGQPPSLRRRISTTR